MRRRGLQGSSNGIKIEFDGELLYFGVKENASFKFSNNIWYSIDKTEWKYLPSNTYTPTFVSGAKVWWYANLTPTSSNGIGAFSSTGKFNVGGNPRCLLTNNRLVDYSFYRLFVNCTSLIDASGLILDSTTLIGACYYGMFQNCAGLTQAPELPATTLAVRCYSYMFYGCSSLTQAPELPATTLKDRCYEGMFYGCSSLTQAPELPATILTYVCYGQMFRGCSKLNYVKSHATNISASGCLSNWLLTVSSTGDFYGVEGVAYPTGPSGIPEGWDVYEI